MKVRKHKEKRGVMAVQLGARWIDVMHKGCIYRMAMALWRRPLYIFARISKNVMVP